MLGLPSISFGLAGCRRFRTSGRTPTRHATTGGTGLAPEHLCGDHERGEGGSISPFAGRAGRRERRARARRARTPKTARGRVDDARGPGGRADDTFRDFLQRSASAVAVPRGGLPYLRRLSAGALGEQRARGILEDGVTSPIARLEGAPSDAVAALLEKEPPQLVAAVLARMDPSHAANILNAMPPERQSTVVRHVGAMTELPAKVLEDVALALANELPTSDASTLVSVDGIARAAELLKAAGREASSAILSAIEANDVQLAGDVRQAMFTFEDLRRLDSKAMRELLREVPSERLTTALKGANMTQPDLFRPLVFSADELGQLMGSFNYGVIGRLGTGVDRHAAEAELTGICEQLSRQSGQKVDLRAAVTPFHEAIAERPASACWCSWARSARSCSLSVSTLPIYCSCGPRDGRSTPRSAWRWGERSQLLRQSLVETLLMALLGGALGVAFAESGLGFLVHAAPPEIPRLDEVRLDGGVLAFAVALTSLIGVIFGLGPAWRIASSDPQGVLKTRGRTLAGEGRRMRNALVVAESGLSATLLILAGLLLAAFHGSFTSPPDTRRRPCWPPTFRFRGQSTRSLRKRTPSSSKWSRTWPPLQGSPRPRSPARCR